MVPSVVMPWLRGCSCPKPAGSLDLSRNGASGCVLCSASMQGGAKSYEAGVDGAQRHDALAAGVQLPKACAWGADVGRALQKSSMGSCIAVCIHLGSRCSLPAHATSLQLLLSVPAILLASDAQVAVTCTSYAGDVRSICQCIHSAAPARLLPTWQRACSVQPVLPQR